MSPVHLVREFGLKDKRGDEWALRPLEPVRERGETLLVLEDPGGAPFARLLGTRMEVGKFLRFAIGYTTSANPPS